MLKTAYRRIPDEQSDGAFELGRAMQVYADAALSLARVWMNAPDLRSGRALAAELLRLRPLSAQARIQLGTASAMYGASLVNGADPQRARPLFEESRKQFRELTQFDPRNRRMLRELAAVQLLTAKGMGDCAENPACRKTMRPGELESAESSTLDSLGRFRDLANKDQDNHALQADISWGLETGAMLLRARDARERALPLLDEALVFRRKAIVDPQDVTTRAGVIDILRAKAKLLGAAGRRDEALKILDESSAAVDELPAGIWKLFSGIGNAQARAELLTAMGRSDQAKRMREEEASLTKALGDPGGARRDRALDLNREGNSLYERADKLRGAAASVEFDEASRKFEEAIKEFPFEAVFWSNLRNACSRSAAALLPADGAPLADGAVRQREVALRCAVENSWIAWVLSDEATGDSAGSDPVKAQRLRTLYEDRRGLAMFLRDDPQRVSEALALADQGVREAEEHAQQQPQQPSTPEQRTQSADALYLLADAYYGLGMMREESKADGWEQAIRAAIGYGERVRDQQPANAERHLWLGNVHVELANRLDNAQRTAAAADERALGQRVCREALRLSKSADERRNAQTCIDTAQGR